jgi:hypothetical protein
VAQASQHLLCLHTHTLPAEAALYRVFTEGIVLGESVDPVYVLYEYVQQEASSRSWDKPGARHLPREGANCSMTLRTLITPTR